jgi:hypothetical protein
MIRNALCLDVVQGYGLTETTAAATVMEQTDRTTGRSGKFLQNNFHQFFIKNFFIFQAHHQRQLQFVS